MSHQPSNQTTTSTTSPPEWAVKSYQDYLSRLGNQYYPNGSPSQSPYVNAQVAPFSPMQEQGLNQVGQVSPYAQGIVGAAGAQDAATASGAYLGPNPALNAYYNAAVQNMTNQYQQSTAPGVTAAAVQAGGLGGSGQNQAEQYAKWGLGQNLGNLAANVYEPAYEAERGRQMQAVGLAPSTAAGQYIPAQQQIQAGGIEQSQLQNVINTAQQNQNQQNLWPYQNLQNYGSGLGVIQGGTQQVVAPNLSQGMK